MKDAIRKMLAVVAAIVSGFSALFWSMSADSQMLASSPIQKIANIFSNLSGHENMWAAKAAFVSSILFMIVILLE